MSEYRGRATGPLVGLLLVVAMLFACARASGEPAAPPATADSTDAARKVRIAERDRFFEQLRNYSAEGNFPEAIASALEMLAVEREVFGEENDDTAGSHAWLSTLYALSGDTDKALDAANKQLTITTKLHGDNAWQTRMAEQQKALVERIAALDEAQRGEAAQAYANYQQGATLYRQGRTEAVRQLLAQAVDTQSKVIGEDYACTADSLAWLGYADQRLKQYDQAAASFERSIAAYRKSLGGDHTDEATVWQSLGNVRYDQQQYDKAAAAYRQAWTIRRACLGADDELTRGALASLKGTLRQQAEQAEEKGELEAAANFLREVLDEQLKAYEDDDWRVVNDRLELQRVEKLLSLGEEQRKRLAEAAAFHTKASKLYGENKYQEAAEPAEQAYATRVELLGQDDPLAASSANLLGIIRSDLKEFDRAKSLLEQAADIWRKTKGPRHPDVGLALFNLAFTYEDQGDSAHAEPLYRQAFEIYTDSYGLDSRSTRNAAVRIMGLLRRKCAMPSRPPTLPPPKRRGRKSSPWPCSSTATTIGTSPMSG